MKTYVFYSSISLNSSQSEKRFRKNCRENQNTYFVFNKLFPPKIVQPMRYCGKIWYSQTDHR